MPGNVFIHPADPVWGDPLAVYVVGEFLGESGGPESCMAWRFIGVFPDADTALVNCVSPYHFVGPAKLGAVHPLDSWPGMYYPLSHVVTEVH